MQTLVQKFNRQENINIETERLLKDISVVVTAMSDAEQDYIHDCISSIFENKHIAEVIVCVVNNNTWIEKKLSNYLDNPKLKIHRISRSNAAATRNYGARVAKSTWVAFCDGDDFWAKDKIQKQLAFATDNSFDIIGGDHFLTDMDGKIRSYPLCRVMPMTSSWLVRKEVMLDYPFDSSLNSAEDSEWWVRVGQKIKKGRCPHLMVYYRVRTNSLSSGTPSKRRKALVVKAGSLPIVNKFVMVFTYLCYKLLRRTNYSS